MELDRRYYNPPTPEYKRLRKVWWGLLIAAIVMTVLSFAGRSFLPETVTYVTLGLAYACIIGALYVDFSKIRKVRRAYQEEMSKKKSKEQRALEKQRRAAEREADQRTAEDLEKTKEELKKRRLFGSGFSLKRAEKAKAEEQADKAGKADGADGGNAVLERAKASAKKASGKAEGQDSTK